MENKEPIDDNQANEPDFFGSYKRIITKYVTEKIELAKLTAAEKIAVAGAMIFSIMLITFFALMFFIFVSVVAGLFLGRLTGSYVTGFACVAACYLIITLAFVAFKSRIEKPIADLIIKLIFKN